MINIFVIIEVIEW